jgi:FtsZ-binding cell division protein ZapB
MGEWVEIARWVALGLVGTAAVIFAPLWFIGLIQTLLEHRREMRQLGAGNDALQQQLQALRNEMEALRRTTTEHHLSLQANLENLQERVRALETRPESHTALRFP